IQRKQPRQPRHNPPRFAQTEKCPRHSCRGGVSPPSLRRTPVFPHLDSVRYHPKQNRQHHPAHPIPPQHNPKTSPPPRPPPPPSHTPLPSTLYSSPRGPPPPSTKAKSPYPPPASTSATTQSVSH